MKANKAVKRLTHAEDLISDVMERYSDGAPYIRQQLLDAKAAVGRAKDAVKAQVPSRTKSEGGKERRQDTTGSRRLDSPPANRSGERSAATDSARALKVGLT